MKRPKNQLALTMSKLPKKSNGEQIDWLQLTAESVALKNKLYRIVAIAQHTETDELLVVIAGLLLCFCISK